jgi:FMN reductase
MTNVVILVGNPKPASRTLAVAQAARAALFREDGLGGSTIDLAEHTAELFEWPSASMDALVGSVAAADVLIVASPTYKASYTGLLKSFLDRYPHNGLDGVVAVPVMTGSDLGHAMAPEIHLRSLLVELGATVPTRGLYFVMSNFDRLDSVVAAWAAENRRRVLAVTRALAGSVLTEPLSIDRESS